MHQLTHSKENGGLKLHIPLMKCKALLINRHLQEIESLPFYNSYINQANPTHTLPADLPCLKQIVNCYPNLPFQVRENPSAYSIHRFFIEQTDRPKVETANPGLNWPRMWKNIASRDLSSAQRSLLFMWVNQKVSHRRLMNIMRRTNGDHCTFCTDATTETVQHKFFDCSRVNDAFNLLKHKLCSLTGSRHMFLPEDLMQPTLTRFSPSSRIKILKILTVYITCIEQSIGRIDVDELKFNFEIET